MGIRKPKYGVITQCLGSIWAVTMLGPKGTKKGEKFFRVGLLEWWTDKTIHQRLFWERATTLLLSISYKCPTWAQPGCKPEGMGISWYGPATWSPRTETRPKRAERGLAGQMKNSMIGLYLWLPYILRKLDIWSHSCVCTGDRHESRDLLALGEFGATIY